eukprot:CAMPEP_0167773810 /NCGR_PEP_ID=MMETSP0111_2-20121227/1642_1 /TAXON_ID=91324 /ORGANISM="Lotharella globosa, Strain CCCM811" /LENGTH=304 /DNA_ID=CAMNT_0007663519 /DNA_START=77 /DNA_END=991 /DNA_ORIENTATION=+
MTKAGYSDEGLSEAEQKARGSMRCGVRTRKGMVPGNPQKVNQDRFIVKWGLQNNNDLALFGAFDGHGPLGHVISEFVAKELPKYLEKQENLTTNPREALMQATAGLCKQISQEKKESGKFSGTTAVYGLKVGDKIYVANLGDSRCVMCTRVGLSSFQATALSKDHKPEDPEEKDRILKAGGRVHPLKGLYGNAGPHRVWLKTQDLPGLAMSRSIGDFIAHSVGVSNIPTITEHQIFPSDKFVVFATDGVWDFMANREVADICNHHCPDMDAAAAAIVNRSCRMWQKNEAVIDDITCVAVQLNEL